VEQQKRKQATKFKLTLRVESVGSKLD